MVFLALFPLNNSIVPLCNLLPSSLLHLHNTFYSSHPIHQLLSNLLQYQSSTYKIFLSLQINHQQPVQFFPLGFNFFLSKRRYLFAICFTNWWRSELPDVAELEWAAGVMSAVTILGELHPSPSSSLGENTALVFIEG